MFKRKATLYPIRDNNEIAKIHWIILKEPLDKLKQTCYKASLGDGDSSCFKEGHTYFHSFGDNNDNKNTLMKTLKSFPGSPGQFQSN